MKKIMKKHTSDEKRLLDLSKALRILQNAGLSDPQILSKDKGVQIQSIIDALCDLSIQDGLTGLMNATFFHAVLGLEIERSHRTGRTCALMVIDIDNFQQINETSGQSTGNSVLQVVASHLKQSLRRMDTAARIGGEKFAVILPECEPSDGIHAAIRIHSSLNPFSIEIEQYPHQLTASIGLVWTNPNMPVNSMSLFSEADRETQRAKQLGRGRLCYKNLDTTLVSHQERSALTDFQIEEGNRGN